MKKVAVYARVSKDEQEIENQLRELQQVAEREQWILAPHYTDDGISGAKGREKRPALDALCNAIVAGKVEMVAVWTVDRLGRSLQDLLTFLDLCRSHNVDLYFHVQRIDTTTSAGRAMFQMLGVFAEFERAMIQERVRAGLARAKAAGKVLGAPVQITQMQIDKAHALKAQGLSYRQISAELRLGLGTIGRILKAA